MLVSSGNQHSKNALRRKADVPDANTSRLRAYDSCKPSGVPWLGDVPSHWEMRKLRSIIAATAERNRPDLPLLSVVRERGVILRDITNMEENHNFVPDDLSNYKVVQSGQLAMNKMKAWQGSYGISQHDGIVSPAYFVFDVNGVSRHYFHAAIRSKAYIPFFAQASDGVRIGQWDLSQARMREIPFPLPPLPEQAAIVRYLDYVDRRIRRYVTAKRRLIALLEEEKQAIVNRAVTRGLDPNVRLKPSGVEWLGDVPEHWDIPRLRNLGDALIGLTYDPQDVVEEEAGILVLRASNIFDGQLVYGDNVFVRSTVPEKLVTREGDILICSRSGSRALIGKNARINAESAGTTFGAFMIVFRGANNDFLHLVFNSRFFEYQSAAFFTSTINQLTLGILYGMKVPFPPLEERQSILRYVEETTAPIYKAVAAAHRKIELLQEYRTRLIADAVTGKLDVRAAAAQLPDEADESLGEELK